MSSCGRRGKDTTIWYVFFFIILLLVSSCGEVGFVAGDIESDLGPVGDEGDFNGGDEGSDPPSSESDPNNRPKRGNRMRTETFVQTNDNQHYDFLWVVDNSSSMEPISQALGEQMSSFVTTLSSRRSIDFQMAMVRTDYIHDRGRLVQTENGSKVVSSGDANAVSSFQYMLGSIGGSPTNFWEQGLESSAMAIAQHGSSFVSRRGPLLVIYLSNEQDYSCSHNCFGPAPEVPRRWFPVQLFPVSRYVNYFRHLRAELPGLNVYTIVSQANDACESPSAGTRYEKVREALGGGFSRGVCPEKAKESFSELSQELAEQGVCFRLGEQAIGNQIEVKVNGETISQGEQGFSYESANNSICFEEAFIPRNGDQISVSYESESL